MMASRTGKDTALQHEKRVQASKNVNLVFTDFNFQGFQVHDKDGNKTHVGKIDLKNPLNDTCSCDSYLYGMRIFKVEEHAEKKGIRMR